ncbi:MAG TPA: hypothetical protein VGL72_31990 [Bryobacteraceae bacterium]|jgi:hypothetical protein
MKSNRYPFTVLATLLWATGIAGASTINSSWSGGSEGWSTSTSWTPTGVPNSLTSPGNLFNVTIDNGFGPFLDIDVELSGLAIGATTGINSALASVSGKTLTVDQNLANNGTLAPGSGSPLIVGGNLTNSGRLETNFVNPSTVATSVSVAGTFANSGTLYLDARGISADSLTAGTLVTSGTASNVWIGKLSTLNVTNELDLNGGTVLVQGALNGLDRLNQFTAGSLALVNQNLNITPAFNNASLQIGKATLELDSTSLTVNGNVVNGGSITTNGIHSNLSSHGSNAFNVSGTLTNNNVFTLSAAGDSSNIGTLVNQGSVQTAAGTTLNLTNQPGGITNIASGTQYSIGGTFTAGSASALANLQTVDGQLALSNGQTLALTPGSGTLNIGPKSIYTGSAGTIVNGSVSLTNGTSWTIAGNVQNQGTLQATGSAFSVTGDFNNAAGASLEAGGTVNLGTLTNAGTVIVDKGANLSAAAGITAIARNSEWDVLGNFTAGGQNGLANLSNIDGALVLANGQTLTSTPGTGTLAATGTLYLGAGTNWTVNGNLLANAQGFAQYTQTSGLTIRGTLNVTGDFNNQSLLELSGTLNAATFENTSTFLSDSGAAVHVTGTFTQTAGLSFLQNVTDFAAGQIDIESGLFQTRGFSANTLKVGNGGTVLGGQASVGAPLASGTNFNASPQLTIAANGALIDNGTVDFGYFSGNPYGLTPTPGSINNAGTVTIGSTGTLQAPSSYTQTSGVTQVDGSLVSPVVNIQGGVLQGGGTIAGTPDGGNAGVALSGAAIQLSDLLAVTGNYSMDSASTFFETIAANQFGALDVSGSAGIAGVLDITLLGDFIPTDGEQFAILTAAMGENGAFSLARGGAFGPGGVDHWQLSYTGNEVLLTANVVPTPEPATDILVGCALLSLGAIGRRARRQHKSK